jgi:hypothetical protein
MPVASPSGLPALVTSQSSDYVVQVQPSGLPTSSQPSPLSPIPESTHYSPHQPDPSVTYAVSGRNLQSGIQYSMTEAVGARLGHSPLSATEERFSNTLPHVNSSTTSSFMSTSTDPGIYAQHTSYPVSALNSPNTDGFHHGPYSDSTAPSPEGDSYQPVATYPAPTMATINNAYLGRASYHNSSGLEWQQEHAVNPQTGSYSPVTPLEPYVRSYSLAVANCA